MRTDEQKRKRAISQLKRRRDLTRKEMCIESCGKAAHIELDGTLRVRCTPCLRRMAYWMQERRERKKREHRRLTWE